jgi:hypothetical protein
MTGAPHSGRKRQIVRRNDTKRILSGLPTYHANAVKSNAEAFISWGVLDTAIEQVSNLPRK